MRHRGNLPRHSRNSPTLHQAPIGKNTGRELYRTTEKGQTSSGCLPFFCVFSSIWANFTSNRASQTTLFWIILESRIYIYPVYVYATSIEMKWPCMVIKVVRPERRIDMQEKYNMTGMSCAACSSRVEKAVSALPGMKECSVNLLKNSMVVQYDEKT